MVPAAALFAFVASSAGQWTLSDGTKVSFVFVLPSAKQAWRSNGDVIPYGSLPKPAAPVWSGKETEPVLVAFLNSGRKFPMSPAVRFKLPATGELPSSFNVPCWDNNVRISGYRPTEHQPSMQDLAIGVANGGWKVRSWVEYQPYGTGVRAVKVHGAPLRLSVGHSGAREGGPYTFLNVPSNPEFDNVVYRFVIKTKNGQEMPFDGMTPIQLKGQTIYRYQGFGGDVYRVILQVRSFEWHTLRVAHFRPNAG